ncbi:unnamed protein product [Angiostrongylus costaricensis]|uniref:Glycine-rich RNA-binding protein GRP1A-like n=1 Tax=Angiostrongylus costaricensis TaxID=334426 RepID=A0A0R3PCR2_ANGCS|nr:unnamed protein product [Angiostrongylus costaricensis]
MDLIGVYTLFFLLAVLSAELIPSIIDNDEVAAQSGSEPSLRMKRQFGWGGGWGRPYGGGWGRPYGGGWGRPYGGGWGRRYGGGWGGPYGGGWG